MSDELDWLAKGPRTRDRKPGKLRERKTVEIVGPPKPEKPDVPTTQQQAAAIEEAYAPRWRGSIKLNDRVHQEIVDALLDGCFDYVAAEAAGITARTFYGWLANPDPRFDEFRAAVMKAKATARRRCELAVSCANPLAWLTKGPGRERPGRDGWTEAVKHEHSGSVETKQAEAWDTDMLSVEELETLQKLRRKATQKTIDITPSPSTPDDSRSE